MITTKGALRNITTGIIHTNIGDVYKFFEEYLGHKGIMTHHLPSAAEAIKPFLKERLSEEWFTDEWIKEGLNEPVELKELSKDEKFTFWGSFNKLNSEMWNSIKDKTVVIK